MQPLDSQTKSGKTIDALIEKLEIECIKTNLCDLEYAPKGNELKEQALKWHDRNIATKDDMIVLLGRWVHDAFDKRNFTIVKLPHPAAFNVFARQDDYVNNALQRIKL